MVGKMTSAKELATEMGMAFQSEIQYLPKSATEHSIKVDYLENRSRCNFTDLKRSVKGPMLRAFFCSEREYLISRIGLHL